MHPLDGPDLFQLAQERPARPMHTLKVALLDGTVDASAVDAWVAEAVTAVAPLRWVLAGPRWARPVWVDGVVPDVGAHVEHAQLPVPGGERELDALLSRLCSGRLDRRRPLWHLTHVSGLVGGGDALVFQVHHALADGSGSVALWEAMSDTAADGSPRGASGHATLPPAVGPRPSDRALRVSALRSGTHDLARLPGQVRRFRRAERRIRRAEQDGHPVAAKPFTGSSTRFNGLPEHERRCAFASLSLDRLQRLRTSTGATLTELFLALGGGAVASHLRSFGEEPDAPLTATVPSGLPVRPHAYGNGVTVLYLSLHSDERDPARRLEAVRAGVAAAKASTANDPRLLPDFQRFPRLYRGVVAGMELEERRRGRPAYNLICSSVRGPRPLTLVGRRVDALRSVGPLAGRFGLNLTAWSYRDELSVGLHSYASAGNGLERIRDHLADQLDQLEAKVAAG